MQDHRVPQGISYKAESPITSFILFFLISFFFFWILYLLKTKLIHFFLSTLKKFPKFYLTFQVSATPESFPPAIPPQALLATLNPPASVADTASSAGNPQSTCCLWIQGLQGQTWFRNALDTGREVLQVVTSPGLVDLAHSEQEPKETHESEGDVVHPSKTQEWKLFISNEGFIQQTTIQTYL